MEAFRKKGGLVVVSAPSGTGKTTIVKKILAEIPDCDRSVSVTTRPPRPGEKEGIDYRFVTADEFREMVDRGELFEWEEVHGHFYGTPRSSIRAVEEECKILLFDIDTRGALSIKKKYKESCLIFLKPPSLEVLEGRLRGRRTDPSDSIERRLEAARREMEEQDKFDYVIINEDLGRAYEEVKEVILSLLRKA